MEEPALFTNGGLKARGSKGRDNRARTDYVCARIASRMGTREMNLHRVRQIMGRGMNLRCPRCGAAPLFSGPFSMYSHCLFCELQFEREHGYFVGAIYINYAVTTILAIVGYFALDRIVGISLTEQLILWCAFAVLFPLIFFRYARSLWLSVDYIFNPENAHGEWGSLG